MIEVLSGHPEIMVFVECKVMFCHLFRGLGEMDDTLQSSGGTLTGDSAKGAELNQIRLYKTTLLKGISLFNKSPKKGMDFLIKEGILHEDAEEIANFFEKTDGLDKTMIGEYLGDTKEICLDVMHAYVDAMDFTGMELDVALR